MKKNLLKIASLALAARAIVGFAACGETGKNVKVLKEIELTAEEYAFAIKKGTKNS